MGAESSQMAQKATPTTPSVSGGKNAMQGQGAQQQLAQGFHQMQGSPMGTQAPFNPAMMFNPGMVAGQNQMMQNMGGGGSMVNANQNQRQLAQGFHQANDNTFARFGQMGGGTPGSQGFQGATFGNMANPNNGGAAGFANSATNTLTGGASTQPGGSMGSSPTGIGRENMERF